MWHVTRSCIISIDVLNRTGTIQSLWYLSEIQYQRSLKSWALRIKWNVVLLLPKDRKIKHRSLTVITRTIQFTSWQTCTYIKTNFDYGFRFFDKNYNKDNYKWIINDDDKFNLVTNLHIKYTSKLLTFHYDQLFAKWAYHTSNANTDPPFLFKNL